MHWNSQKCLEVMIISPNVMYKFSMCPLYHNDIGRVKIYGIELVFKLWRHLLCKVDSDMDYGDTADAKECHYM